MAIISFLCLLLTLLSQATAQPGFLYNFCINEKGNYTANSTYQRNFNTLLSSISSPTQTDDYGFFNLSYGQSSDRVNAIALCRGDVNPDACQACLNDSIVHLTRLCPNQKEAIGWYDNCMLRYSNRSIFDTVETLPAFYMTNLNNATSVDQFNQVLRKLLDDLRSKAASGDSHRKFAAENATGPDFLTIYGLVQCTPDLSSQQCTDCLVSAISQLPQSSGGKVGGRYVTPSCNYRYETYRFYNTTYDSTPPPPDAPSTQATVTTYLGHNCTGSTSATYCLTYLSDSLSSQATGKTEFYNYANCKSETNQTISSSGIEPIYGYGLFMCSGYVTLQHCHQCVHEATARLSFDYCPNSTKAIIWYNECMVRYSNSFFFSTADTSPSFTQTNDTYFNFSDSESYIKLLLDTMNATAEEAAKPAVGEKKYATRQANISRSQSLYCAAQCTPDLIPEDCRSCLSDAIGELNPKRQGGRILYPSCNVRYESYPFDQNTVEVVAPAPSGTNASGKSRKIMVVAISIVGSGIILFCIAFYFLQKKMRKGYKVLLKEIFGIESSALESLQFSLATIEAATNKFSEENKIGRGGFGEVYKGILLDGREIAIKRLSRSSGQGAREFKNEVSLMAKLQHRNLVTLLGFCLEGQEKILIYEYVPNNSLDFFLFGTQKTRALNWSTHYKIIEGIAQGILYLHKYSRLKIIHRDLKPSNVLLDNKMNPKISDFGMARMVGIDETQGSTNRIVGTYGYMSPEYAMFGQFSEESDVFSFGVMVLEIISGKKNARNGLKSQCVDDLLSYAWKQWRDKKVLEILDSSLTEVGSPNDEVIKCIHIGLLCVQDDPNARPPMITVVQYLNNDSIELPLPKEPAFFIHGRIEPINIEANEPGSINMMSASELFPR